MTLSVIVNADDFGLTAGVNESILACHLMGSVTSTTLMVNMDGARHAAEIARAHPSLGVGLHFNLTQGAPCSIRSTVSSLIDEAGQFHPRSTIIKMSMLGRIDPSHVRAELLTQLGRMAELGLKPTHIDSHQHVHSIPLIFAVVSQIAESMSLPLRMTWGWPGRAPGKSLKRRLSELALDLLNKRCARLKSPSLLINDGLCSAFDLTSSGTPLTESSYITLLSAYSSGFVELMVHPAIVDEGLRQMTEITKISASENLLLRSDFLNTYLAQRGGRLARYSDIAKCN